MVSGPFERNESMSDMLFIGLDLGTSALKLLLMDDNGAVLKTVSRSFLVHYPHPGWSEQFPEDWIDATFDGLRELLDGIEKQKIKGISFAGQMHGLVILDADDKVIRPAILWNDGRTEQETKYLNQEIGEALLVQETGNIAFAGFTAPKILWLKKHEPEHFAKIKKIMLPKDYLIYLLSGQHATDVSDASGTLLFDVEHQRWSHKMLEICGVQEAQLPTLYRGSDPVGTIRSDVAKRFGLNDDVKIMAGAGDNAAAAVATGTVVNGKGNISLGTSGTLFVATDAFLPLENHAVHQFCHTDGSYHLMGCMLSAASAYSWWREGILQQETNVALQNENADGLYFLPYLMGERSPHNDEAVRGAFIGLSMETTAEAMGTAVLEGVSFGMRDSLEIIRELGMELSEMTVTGGGAKNAVWQQMLSDIMDAKLAAIGDEVGPAYGAAILAAVGCGVWPSVKAASTALMSSKRQTVQNSEAVAYYEKKYRKYTDLYPRLRTFFA